jgi:hypothetical protein
MLQRLYTLCIVILFRTISFHALRDWIRFVQLNLQVPIRLYCRQSSSVSCTTSVSIVLWGSLFSNPGPVLCLQVQNDSETEPGATERIVTLIGNKKATDIAYDMIKEVIDEVHFQEPFVEWLCTTLFACLCLCDFLNGVFYGSLPCFFWAITRIEAYPVTRNLCSLSLMNCWRFFIFPPRVFVAISVISMLKCI